MVSGDQITLEYTLSVGDFEITVSMSGEIEGDSMSGDAIYEMPFRPEPMEMPFEGTRDPDSNR